MKDLARILNFLNAVVVTGVEGRLQGDDGTVSASGEVQRIDLRAGDLEGLTVEEVRFGLKDFALPSADSGTNFRPYLEKVVLTISQSFWRRAAELTGERVLAGAGTIMDRVVMEGLEVSTTISPEKLVDVEVRLSKVTLLRGDRTCCELTNLKLAVEGFNLAEQDRTVALAASTLYLDSLDLRVFEEFLNRAVEVGKRKAPPELDSLQFRFSSRDGMTVRGAVKKIVRLPFGVRLSLATEGNMFRVYFRQFFLGGALPLPALTRTALLKLVKMAAAKRPELEATDHYLFINPWPRLPLKVETRALRCLVVDGALAVTFGPAAGREALQEFSLLEVAGPERPVASRPDGDKGGARATVKRRMAPPGPPPPGGLRS